MPEMDIQQAIENMKKFRRLNFWHTMCGVVAYGGLLLLSGVCIYCYRTKFSRATEAKIVAALLVMVLLYIVESKHDEVAKEIRDSNNN